MLFQRCFSFTHQFYWHEADDTLKERFIIDVLVATALTTPIRNVHPSWFGAGWLGLEGHCPWVSADPSTVVIPFIRGYNRGQMSLCCSS